MEAGDIIPTGCKTRDGLRVMIQVGADGLGERLYSLVKRHPTGIESLDAPAHAAGLFHPRKGGAYFRSFPDARRAVEENFEKMESVL